MVSAVVCYPAGESALFLYCNASDEVFPRNKPLQSQQEPCDGRMAGLVAGLLCICCNKKTSDKFFGAPVEIHRDITNAVPI